MTARGAPMADATLAGSTDAAGGQALPMRRPVLRGLFAPTSVTGSLSAYVPATIAFRLINFVRLVLMTWWMTQSQYGLFNLLLIVINVLTPLCSLGLNEAVTRYAPMHETRGSLFDFVRRSLVLISLLAVLSIALLAVAAPLLGVRFYGQFTVDAAVLAQMRADQGELARLSSMVIGLLMFYFYLLSVMKGLRMYRALALMELFHGVVFLVLAVVAAVTQHRSAFTMTACYGLSLVAAIIPFGIGLWSVLRQLPDARLPIDDPTFAGRLLRFSLWATVASVLWQVLQYYPAWYLNKISGPESVAVFSAVRQIGQFVLVGAVAIVTVVMSQVTKTWEREGPIEAQRQLSLAFRAVGLVLLMGCMVLAVGRHLVMRLYAHGYAVGADILPVQLLFFLMGGHLAFLAIHFNLIEKPRHLFWPWAIGVGSNVLLAALLMNDAYSQWRASAMWKAIEPMLAAVLPLGVSDAMKLGAATWSGSLAVVLSLLTCLWLLRYVGRRLDGGSWLILSATLLLAMRSELMLAGGVAILLIAWRTGWLFSDNERRQLSGYMRSMLRMRNPVARP
ncbi:MAG: lipopolysaccharide biosynthesis protein [Phycisphaerae bacterium]|nr:lipopolysaccharide biosynthesis protein [Phycisphaerae bacterium]NUQ44861.1 lipopolysaccharide biosynthesis protein [Phycisphaerae bacterium]